MWLSNNLLLCWSIPAGHVGITLKRMCIPWVSPNAVNSNEFKLLIQGWNQSTFPSQETWLLWQTLGGLMYEKTIKNKSTTWPIQPLCNLKWARWLRFGDQMGEVDQKTESLINFPGDQNEEPPTQMQRIQLGLSKCWTWGGPPAGVRLAQCRTQHDTKRQTSWTSEPYRPQPPPFMPCPLGPTTCDTSIGNWRAKKQEANTSNIKQYSDTERSDDSAVLSFQHVVLALLCSPSPQNRNTLLVGL